MRHPARSLLTRLCVVLVTIAFAAVGLSAPAMAHPSGPSQRNCRATDKATRAQHDLLTRVIGERASRQVCFVITPTKGGVERFTVAGKNRHITITATTPSAASQGAGWYLKYVVHAAANLGNPHPVMPKHLPAPQAAITKTANTAQRYVGNDTQDGYTDPYMGWKQWQSMLDIYALHGINQVYVLPGTDAVYQKVLQDFGYSAAQTRAWIPLPTTQPWWVMQNVSNYGAPIPQSLLDQRATLGRQISDRARELGMVPVLPGFIGTVPTDFSSHAPVGTKVLPQGNWSGQPRPAWLSPADPFFKEVAADYYRRADQVLGTSSVYRMNPLQEGGTSGGVPQQDIMSGIMQSLQASEPDATWMQLGWQGNPTSDQLEGIEDKSHFVVSDGLSDASASWDRESTWPDTPYLFGSIYAFGGHTVMGAAGQVWIDRYYSKLATSGNNMVGIAVMPEGFEDPAAFELLSELPWRSKSFSLDSWMTDYALGRYGTADAAPAWELIASTAYSLPRPSNGTHAEPAESLFAASPSLTAKNADPASPTQQPYDMARFATALPQLILADRHVVQRAAYDFDLAAVSSNVVGNETRNLLPRIKSAYQAKDQDTFRNLTNEWLHLMNLTDEVSGSVPWFKMGTYTESARDAAGANPNDQSQLVDSLLYLWTSWVDPANGFEAKSLNNYANHTYEGLLHGYYEPNWRTYFESLTKSLQDGTTPPSIDWVARARAYVESEPTFDTMASGDTVALAQEIADELSLSPLTVSRPAQDAWLAAAPTEVGGLGAPGGVVTITEGATTLCTASVGPDHEWTCALDDLDRGRHVLSVVETGAGARLSTTARFTVGVTEVDHWSMDESTGSAIRDSATSGYDGTRVGDASSAPGKVGNGVRFTGGDGSIVTSAPDLPAPWSAAAWVNVQGGKTSMALLNSNTSIVKINSKSGTVGVTRRDVADYAVPYAVPKNTWTYLTFVDDGARITVYANGSAVGTMNASTPLGRAAIGSYPPKDSTIGTVDELAVYSGAMNADQVRDLYASMP